MKKTLSVIITLAMIVAMVATLGLGASAAGAVECDSWADVVAAVEADATASIKLIANVLADETIASFAGTFDGNGKAVTVEKTMFAEVTGTATLKNFQTVAAAAIAESPIVHLIKGDATVTFQNVVNNVDVAGSTKQVGGFAATSSGTVSITMTSCVNNGDLQSVNQVSGIFGNLASTETDKATLNLTDVVNNGNITGNQNYAGGIYCAHGSVEGMMTRVINNGDIVVESKKDGQKGSNAAGLIGTSKGKALVTLTDCVNTGDVTLITPNTSAHYGAAAFAIRTDSSESVFTLSGCVNTGVMTSASEGTSTDAIALPKKNGTVAATDCLFVEGETTVAQGATKVDATAAATAIEAIEAQMTLPEFEEVTPETGDNTLAALFVVVAIAAVACTTIVLRKREQN